jgi:hypothetical protein
MSHSSFSPRCCHCLLGIATDVAVGKPRVVAGRPELAGFRCFAVVAAASPRQMAEAAVGPQQLAVAAVAVAAVGSPDPALIVL